MTRSHAPGARLSGRLGIRGKVALLALVPLVLVVLVAVPLGCTQASAAVAATRTAGAVSQAQRIGHLAQQLQRESLFAAALSADPAASSAELGQQQRAVDVELNHVRGNAPAEMAGALGRVSSLSQLRGNTLHHSASPDDIAHGYDVAITGMIDALGLVAHTTSDGDGLRQLGAVDSLLRANEQRALRLTALVAGAGLPGQSLVDSAGQRASAYEERFAQQADPGDAALVAGVESSALARQFAGTQISPGMVTAATELAGQRAVAQDEVLDSIVGRTAAGANEATRRAWFTGGAAVVLFGLVLVFAVLIGRSISRPMRRLASQARAAAALSDAEFAQIVEPTDGAPAALPELNVASGGEPAEVAEAFNRLRGSAVEAVSREAASRRAATDLLAGAARRTQNLISSQRALVGELRRSATEPVLSADLHRLDRTAARLRRTADDLLVVSGDPGESSVGGPVELATALRSAAEELDDEAQVRLAEPAAVQLVPSLGPDLVLVFSELLDNAAAFSPPDSFVDVATRFQADGDLLVSITDHGVGLPAERLAEENRRLAAPDEGAPVPQLGLAVVAKLARRHGLTVELQPTEADAGLTAQITVPYALFTRNVDTRHEPEPVGLFEPGQIPDPVPDLLPAPAIAAPDSPVADGFGWFAIREPDWPAAEPDDDFAASAGTLAGLLEPSTVDGPDTAAAANTADTADTADAAADAADAVDPVHGEAAADPQPTQRFAPVRPEQRDGIERRVPGAQLAPELRLPQAVRAPSARRGLRDPAAERARFDAFSDGVAKAEQATAVIAADQGGP
ncbi:nitrate- and nitrite sensing domain-containing protein [Amycolatopsis ultiminotia]|uniref:histidine kinase n=1 Tax=Amycolatopsis ultiminotia TaxID=543629 RepID=A0ABP6WZ95_9PSEU